jgi:hypothetical protein
MADRGEPERSEHSGLRAIFAKLFSRSGRERGGGQGASDPAVGGAAAVMPDRPPGARPTDSFLHRLLDDADNEPQIEAGTQVDQYLVGEREGVGGFGVVYAAFDTVLRIKVALKFWRRPLQRARLLIEEARALAKVSHPNVVGVWGTGQFEGGVYVALHYVDGSGLREWLMTAGGRSRPSTTEVIRVMTDVARGLAATHRAGLVHRDLKPDNIMITTAGTTKLLDFGLAYHWEGLLDAEEALEPSIVAGTPAYLAPELLAADGEGEAPYRSGYGQLSDQFSFFVTLYEALCGERPWSGDTPAGLDEHQVHQAVVAGSRSRSVPGWLRPILERGLSPDPSARFASMEEVVELLGKDPARRVRRFLWALAGSVFVAAVLTAGLYLRQDRRIQQCLEQGSEVWANWGAATRPALEREVELRMEALGQPCALEPSDAAEKAPSGPRATSGAVGQALRCRRQLEKEAEGWLTLPLADMAWAMDRREEQWTRERSRVCSASIRGRGAVKRRAAGTLACMDERLAELASWMAELPREWTVARAEEAAVRLLPLPSFGDCNRTQPAGCGLVTNDRYLPLEPGRSWVFRVVPGGDEVKAYVKPLRVEGEDLLASPKEGVRALRIRRVEVGPGPKLTKLRWQEVVPNDDGGQRILRHKDLTLDASGEVVDEEYYFPSRIRLDEACASTVGGAAFMDAYVEVRVVRSSEGAAIRSRQVRAYRWTVVAEEVLLPAVVLDYSTPGCCEGAEPCRPQPDGPGHRCRRLEGSDRWECDFVTLQVARQGLQHDLNRKVNYWFAPDVGKVREDAHPKEEETLLCFQKL